VTDAFKVARDALAAEQERINAAAIKAGAAENPMRVRPMNVERLNRMYVRGATKQYAEPPRKVLMDIGSLDAGELLVRYTGRQSNYCTTPFDVNGDSLRLYSGGLTIWSGFPGNGKTSLLRQFVCQTLKRGQNLFLASLEEEPHDTIIRVAGAAVGKAVPTKDDLAWFIDNYAEQFRLWSIIGTAKHAEMLAVIRELAEQGTRHAIIDSLMCLDVANDDYEGQRKFANLVTATARACDIHIHLVAHPRKLISAQQELDLNDVAGARELGGLSDNVLFVGRDTDSVALGPDAGVTGMTVSIRKQRHYNGAHAKIMGWYNRTHRQFHPGASGQFITEPTWYLSEEARA
jgi:KaiC/GvpD/RAD55 family RecA-like ATPase